MTRFGVLAGLAGAYALGGCALVSHVRDQIQGVSEPLPVDTPAPDGSARPVREHRMIMSKSGPEVKVVTGDRYDGALYGFRSVRYLVINRSAYFGGMAYGSLPGDVGEDLSPLFGYAGVLAGYEGTLMPWPESAKTLPWWMGFDDRNPTLLGYDLNLHLGLTRDLGATIPSGLARNISLEPSVSLSLPMPFFKGVRLALSGGYLYLPLAPEYAGWTFGAHIDTKSFQVQFPVE